MSHAAGLSPRCAIAIRIPYLRALSRRRAPAQHIVKLSDAACGVHLLPPARDRGSIGDPPMSSMAVNIQPQPSSSEHPNAVRARLGASPTWGFPPRRRQRWEREQVVLAHHPEHPLAGNTDATTDPKPSPDLRPPRGSASMATSRASSEIRSPALCWWALSGGLLPGFHGVERGTGKTPGRTDPLEAVGQTRCSGRGGGTHRRRAHAAPKGRTSPSWPPAVPPAQLPDPLLDVQFRLHRIALAARHRSAIASHATEPENLHAHCRDKSSTGSPRKSRRATSLARHRAGQVSGPAGETWPGENVDEPSSPSFTAHQQQLCSHCRSCSGPGHFD